MKSILLALLFILPGIANSQDTLVFNKRFMECENKWVFWKSKSDTSYAIGFIYMDYDAGLTLDMAGNLVMQKDGKYNLVGRNPNAAYKVRLKPGNTKVAVVPPSRFAELGISQYPEWLKIYLGNDTSSVDRLYRWGYLYNSYNECATALNYLERAYQKNPDFKGLLVELGFSYNCLGRYSEAEKILEIAVKKQSENCYVYKEWSYALVQSNQLEKAGSIIEQAGQHCKDSTYLAEMYYNLVHGYYRNKNKAGLLKWAPDAKKWAAGNQTLILNLNRMEKELENL